MKCDAADGRIFGCWLCFVLSFVCFMGKLVVLYKNYHFSKPFSSQIILNLSLERNTIRIPMQTAALRVQGSQSSPIPLRSPAAMITTLAPHAKGLYPHSSNGRIQILIACAASGKPLTSSSSDLQ